MRTLILLVSLLFCFSQTVTAEHFTGKCRKGYSKNNLTQSLVQNIENDLTSGVWTINLEEGKETLFFFPDGSADILVHNTKGEITHYQTTWKVEEYSDHAFLVLSQYHSQKEKLYQLNSTCEGMILTNVVAGEKSTMIFHEKVDSAFHDQLKRLLTGAWKSISYPFNVTQDATDCGTVTPMEDAFLEVSLEYNGNYTLQMGAGEYGIIETGQWHLTPDADYLIFSSSVAQTSRMKSTRVASINMLEYHEMVIEQKIDLDITDKEFCSDWKPFHFHKLSI